MNPETELTEICVYNNLKCFFVHVNCQADDGDTSHVMVFAAARSHTDVKRHDFDVCQ